MLIRIDDSVFTVDESEAYTVLRLIKKVLIPKIEAVGDASESVKQLEDEVGAIHEANERQDVAIQANRTDINHVLGTDIPNLEGQLANKVDMPTLEEQLANKVDKYNPRVESWNVVKSLDGKTEKIVGTVDVNVNEMGNIVFFSAYSAAPFTWGTSGDASARFAIKLPDENAKCILCNGIISQTSSFGYYLTPMGGSHSKYIFASNKTYNIMGWYDMDVPSAATIGGTALQMKGFYIKEV